MPGHQVSALKHRARRVTAGPTVDDAGNPTFLGTEKQLRFIQEWAAGNSIRNAAVRAGYTDGGASAYAMSRHPDVLAIYYREVKKREEASMMSMEKFMTMLTDAYDMAKMQAEPLAMVAAAREIGKACGYFAPREHKIEIKTNEEIVKIERKTDAELVELIAKSTPRDEVRLPAPDLSLEDAVAQANAEIAQSIVESDEDEDEDDPES
jgi:phage terminase small subunit